MNDTELQALLGLHLRETTEMNRLLSEGQTWDSTSEIYQTDWKIRSELKRRGILKTDTVNAYGLPDDQKFWCDECDDECQPTIVNREIGGSTLGHTGFRTRVRSNCCEGVVYTDPEKSYPLNEQSWLEKQSEKVDGNT